MSKQEKITAAMAIIFVTNIMALLGITNYDSVRFYQSDLDNERAKLSHIERNIDDERHNNREQARNLAKQTAQYAQLQELYKIHSQNPEVYAHLEPKMDSLSNVIDSLENHALETYTGRMDALHKEHANTTEQIERLARDSVIADSIARQPLGPRFRKNWNTIFNQRQH